jgi:hypothetical protein
MATVAAPALTIHRLDVGTYDQMVASGALEGEPVELLEGLLVEVMSPQSPAHAAVIEEQPPPGEHPRTALLVVEVPLSSPQVDRGVKAGLYARAGVPTYWIVDVLGKSVEVRTDPGAEGYGRCEVYKAGDRVPSPAEGVPDLDVGALLNGLA